LERKVALQDEVNCEIINLLQIKDIEYQLIKYGIYRLDKFYAYKYNMEQGLNGILLEDLIGDVIEAFLTGKRHWYKDKFSDFKKQFISAYDSVISNQMKQISLLPDNKFLNGFDIPSEEKTDNYDDLLEFCLKILKDMGSSDEELLIFEPYIIQKQKRADIAKEFGISECELTNYKKRLDRKLSTLGHRLKIYLNE
jgi:hypothetical protein